MLASTVRRSYLELENTCRSVIKSQSIMASESFLLGVRLFASLICGSLFLAFGFCSFLRATITGTEDLVTR